MISCENYIDRMVRAYSWENLSSKPFNFATKMPSPLPDNCLDKIFKESDPDEGTPVTYKIESEIDFAYRILLGKMMYTYVTCRPDIGYAVTNMSRFSTKPSALHYKYLCGIAKYLCRTKDWGIKFKRTAEHPALEDSKFQTDVFLPPNLPEFTVDINQPKLIAFVDASYTNDPQKRCSTTGLYSPIAVVLLSINQRHKVLQP